MLQSFDHSRRTSRCFQFSANALQKIQRVLDAKLLGGDGGFGPGGEFHVAVHGGAARDGHQRAQDHMVRICQPQKILALGRRQRENALKIGFAGSQRELQQGMDILLFQSVSLRHGARSPWDKNCEQELRCKLRLASWFRKKSSPQRHGDTEKNLSKLSEDLA